MQYSNVLVAYSGGTDSVLLLAAALKALGPQGVIAVTAVSDTYTEQELNRAQEIAIMLGARHMIIHSGELNIDAFRQNNIDRCYYCKRHRFELLQQIATQKGLLVIEGSNTDDVGDYRPGMRAIRELGIISPLQQAKLSKQEIREISKQWGLPTWNVSSQSCLATRIGYGITITKDRLKRIANAEKFLIAIGLEQVRVRDHGDIARIEVRSDQLELLISNKLLIIEVLKKIGFTYVTADLAGYVSGSMNKTIGGMVSNE